jgi:hypothetical protein
MLAVTFDRVVEGTRSAVRVCSGAIAALGAWGRAPGAALHKRTDAGFSDF